MANDGADSPTDAFVTALSLAEIIRLQDRLSKELKVRFEKQLALGFSDIVGSTAYLARFGDEAGRKLQQRHLDFIHGAVDSTDGRVVDTAGDGAFMVFPKVDTAAATFIAIQNEISRDNAGRPSDQQLVVRIGFHWGSALTDGKTVTGEAVNLAARVAACAGPGAIRLTKEAFHEFSSVTFRLSSRPLGPVNVKGLPRPIDLMALAWRDRRLFPDSVRIKETGEVLPLPEQDIITFGRLKESDGLSANDIVLTLPNEVDTRKVSRWHFELRGHPDGFRLRAVSDHLTEVNGEAIGKGVEIPIRPGSVVRLARVATLEFFNQAPVPMETGDVTWAAD